MEGAKGFMPCMCEHVDREMKYLHQRGKKVISQDVQVTETADYLAKIYEQNNSRCQFRHASQREKNTQDKHRNKETFKRTTVGTNQKPQFNPP